MTGAAPTVRGVDPSDLSARLRPVAEPAALTGTGVAVVLVVAVAATATPALWRHLRLAVTLVHELGHAVVGVAAGRRFTGFVLRGDASGHAVTVGPARGLGVVATTWAGYPMPALVGAGLVLAGAKGWAAPVLAASLVALLVALLFVRSALTGLVVLTVGLSVGALWWWRDDPVQQHVLVGVGVVLLVGAWRHLGSLVGDRSPRSDTGALAHLTGVPAVVWLVSFALACAVAAWAASGPLLAPFA